MKDSLIIVSGGMDSVTLLYEKKESIALAISFDYGSNHNQKEIPFAKLHCERLGIKHIVIPLNFIHDYFKSSLLEGAEAIPEGNYDDENMKSTVVPFRNGIMLSIACGIAESNGLKKVLIANHFGDHAIYPDCRKGLEGTPDSIIRMWKEIFRGYDPSQKPKITTFDNNDDGIVYDNMVIDQGDFHSNCEHHCVWFWGKYWFAYIPNPKGKILGISKIGRVVDYCSARLQIQERLVHDIVDMLKDALGSEYPPLGIALVMKGHHSCKEFRGAKKKGIMTSSYLEGAFKDDPQVRAEFMNLVNGDKYEG